MTKFIRNNTKKLLALFMVILMIAFILPAGMKQFGAGQRQLVGYIGNGAKVYNTDISRAKAEWEILQHYVMLSPQMTGGRPMSVLEAIASTSQEMRTLANQVQAHPETYFLLQQEAENMGIRVTAQQAEQFFRQQNLNVRLQNGAIVDLDHVSGIPTREQIIDSVAALPARGSGAGAGVGCGARFGPADSKRAGGADAADEGALRTT
jgi:hypothetical protein